MKSLYVIDASGYLYRSYFAIRNITNSKGESTNALYGFIRSIQKLRKDFKPEYLISVFDGPRSIQKREKIYIEYKAHRKSMPPDLVYQMTWARQACDLMGIPHLSAPEVEADDAMGSIALWGEKHGFHVYLCTSDKDLCQLVNDKISILNTFKDNQILGPREVEEIHGVPPSQMIDLLSLTGDTSDNIPGVPGFGPKTAAGLLKEFGSLDYLLKNPEVIPGKKQEVFIKHADDAILSRQLVTIHEEVDFPNDPNFFAIKDIDIAPLKDFYASMNFNTLIRELEQQVPNEPHHFHTKPEELPVTYQIVDDDSTFSELLHILSAQKEISLSVKASNLLPMKAEMVGIAFSTAPGKSWYLPVNGSLGLNRVISGLKDLIENPNIGFYSHNIKYDYLVLSNYGIKMAKIAFDTMLASYLLNSHVRQHTLDHLVLEHFGKVKESIADLLGKGKKAISMIDVPIPMMAQFACEDADYICRLRSILEKNLQERHLTKLLTDLELPLLPVLANMERHGIYLDIPYLHKMSHEIQNSIQKLEQEIYELAGETFNINSPKQMSNILFIKMGIKPPKKTATGLSTNADVLESLKHDYPIAGKLLEYRTLEKLRSTYVDSLPSDVLPKTQRIHCTFNQTVAATGRLSCQDPNLQNIPIRSEIGRTIRGGFRPQREGWSYLAADYSQIELRILAHMCEDPNLMHAFQKGEDIHTHTASIILNLPLGLVTKALRYQAKAVNFGVIYGQQAFGLSQELGIDVKEAAKFIDMYFKQYPRVKEFVEESKEKVRKTGRAVTATGRERLIPEIHSKNGIIRSAAERLAVNSPLQGMAADLIKMAMLEIDQKLKQQNLKGFMILQIHDELVFEAPDEEIGILKNLVRDTMQGVLKLKVPLVVDISVGKNWAQC